MPLNFTLLFLLLLLVIQLYLLILGFRFASTFIMLTILVVLIISLYQPILESILGKNDAILSQFYEETTDAKQPSLEIIQPSITTFYLNTSNPQPQSFMFKDSTSVFKVTCFVDKMYCNVITLQNESLDNPDIPFGETIEIIVNQVTGPDVDFEETTPIMQELQAKETEFLLSWDSVAKVSLMIIIIYFVEHFLRRQRWWTGR